MLLNCCGFSGKPTLILGVKLANQRMLVTLLLIRSSKQFCASIDIHRISGRSEFAMTRMLQLYEYMSLYNVVHLA